MLARALALATVPQELREERGRLGAAALGSRRNQRVAGVLQRFVGALVSRVGERPSKAEQELR